MLASNLTRELGADNAQLGAPYLLLGNVSPLESFEVLTRIIRAYFSPTLK